MLFFSTNHFLLLHRPYRGGYEHPLRSCSGLPRCRSCWKKGQPSCFASPSGTAPQHPKANVYCCPFCTAGMNTNTHTSSKCNSLNNINLQIHLRVTEQTLSKHVTLYTSTLLHHCLTTIIAKNFLLAILVFHNIFSSYLCPYSMSVVLLYHITSVLIAWCIPTLIHHYLPISALLSTEPPTESQSQLPQNVALVSCP